MSYLQMYSTGGCYVLFRSGGNTILVSGCFCAQWSVAPARGHQYKERVSWVWGVQSRGLHGSKNSYPNPKRPVNMLHGTDPDPYFIWKWDPNPCRPEKYLKCTTRTRRGPDHYSKVGPEPGWEDTDPTVPVPIGTYCTANAIKSINKLRKKNFFP